MEREVQTPARQRTAQILQEQIKAAKVANNNRFARKALRELRGLKLWRELGFTSFNDYAKSDACPYSSNYAYKLAALPTDLMPVHGEIVDEETGQTLQYFDDPPLAAPEDIQEAKTASPTDPLLASGVITAKDLAAPDDLADMVPSPARAPARVPSDRRVAGDIAYQTADSSEEWQSGLDKAQRRYQVHLEYPL